MGIYEKFAYHYYDTSFPAFSNLSEKPYSEAILLDHKSIHDKEKYLMQRTTVEKIMLSFFRRKGGNPQQKYAHYFSVGPYSELISYYKRPCAVKIPISCFDKDKISFTFGDSFYAFFVSPHPTKRKLYMVDEMDNIMSKYQVDKYMKYIEMQLWDNPEKYRKYMVKDDTVCFHNLQLTYENTFSNELKLQYIKYCNLINPEHYFYPEGIHGISHTKRVLIHCIILAKLNNLSEKQRNILFLSAIYHDIGRTTDKIDQSHGYNSWNTLSKLGLTKLFSEEDNYKIKHIIVNHCLEDSNEDRSNTDNDAQRLLYLFKDADALDRVRINNLNVNLLRNMYSRQMIGIAWKIFKYDTLLDNKI